MELTFPGKKDYEHINKYTCNIMSGCDKCCKMMQSKARGSGKRYCGEGGDKVAREGPLPPQVICEWIFSVSNPYLSECQKHFYSN